MTNLAELGRWSVCLDPATGEYTAHCVPSCAHQHKTLSLDAVKILDIHVDYLLSFFFFFSLFCVCVLSVCSFCSVIHTFFIIHFLYIHCTTFAVNKRIHRLSFEYSVTESIYVTSESTNQTCTAHTVDPVTY